MGGLVNDAEYNTISKAYIWKAKNEHDFVKDFINCKFFTWR